MPTWMDFDEVDKARGGGGGGGAMLSVIPSPTGGVGVGGGTKRLGYRYGNLNDRGSPSDMWGKKNHVKSPTSVDTDLIDTSSQRGDDGIKLGSRNITPRRRGTSVDSNEQDKTDDAIVLDVSSKDSNAVLVASMKSGFVLEDPSFVDKPTAPLRAASPAQTLGSIVSDNSSSTLNRRAPSPASRMLNNAASRAAAAAAKEEARRQKKAVRILKKLEEEEEKWTALASKTASRRMVAESEDVKEDDRTNDDNDHTTNDDDDITYDNDTMGDGTYNDETTMGDTTYADDTTYGDVTSYYDDMTMGSGTYADDTTIGESTWTSDVDASYHSREDEDPARLYSPRHKQPGNMPEPILKSSIGKNSKRGAAAIEKRRRRWGEGADSSAADAAKRVTIHSHRGRGEDNDTDFALFDTGTCPSLSMIRDELQGTYQDLTHTWRQVTSAFVISTDDIDRLADKIRDAKIELGENYARQVEERSGGSGGGGTTATTTPNLPIVEKKRQIKKKSSI